MRLALPGTNVTVFLLFFGLALLDAIGAHRWLSAALWFVVGLFFLGADLKNRRQVRGERLN